MNEKFFVFNSFGSYGHSKLYQPYSVDDYLKEIRDNNLLSDHKNIELNLQSCRLGYPSTPRYIDFFLNHLSRLDGQKNLIIKMGCISYFEWVFLNIIVLEGSFFGVSKKLTSNEDVECVKKTMSEILKKNNIHMTIVLNDSKNTSYNYGY